MFRIFSFSNKIFISLLAILVFGLSSCRTTPPNYDDYYRELNYYNGYSMGLDISLLRCDFSSFVNINQDLKSKLDRVNTETTISPNSNLDGLYFVGDRTFSLIGRAGSSSFTAGTAWIIAQDNTNTYAYWMMTNWHVTIDWITTNSYYNDVRWATIYNNYETSAYPLQVMEYEQFKTNKVFKAPEKYTASISSSKLLTPFRHNGNAIGTRVISAGFPFFKNQQTQENFSQFKFNTSTFSDTSKVKDYYLNSEPTDPNNWFLLSDNHKIASTGNWYVFSDYSFGDMFPGSSGSMVIDDNLQVLGIYWGGFDDGTSQNVRYPCGVMFDTQGDWSGSQRPYYNYNKLDVIGRIIGCQL